MAEPRLLIVDDDPGVRSSLALFLEERGYTVETAASADAAVEAVERTPFDVILCDVRMPGRDGLEVLPELLRLQPDTTLVMMSAYGEVEQAVDAVRRGAYDYIAKPFDPQELVMLLRKAQERERLRRENRRLRRELGRRREIKSLVAISPGMQEVVQLIERASQFRSTVLITGESGVGKEVVAQAIHGRGERNAGPFVAVNCGAIPENLMEAELFGHARGAYTGAEQARLGLFREADGGALLLDEIGELPQPLQVKLLRVLQEQEVRPVGEPRSVAVDVRILAATARELETEVRAGRFRQDLYYRLNVFRIHVPPLRERLEDLPLLAQQLLEGLARQMGRRVPELEPTAIDALCAHPWPGNVRELENTLERALILASGDRIPVDLLPFADIQGEEGSGSSVAPGEDLSIKRRTRALEERLIRMALETTGGNRTRAAGILEISPRALQYKLKEYAIVPLNPHRR